MPLPDWFWDEQPPPAAIIPPRPFAFEDLADGDMLSLGRPTPHWIKLQQGDTVRLSFFTDKNNGNALMFQKTHQGVSRTPYTRHYVVAAASDPDREQTRRADFKVGFVGMSTKAIMDLRAVLQQFRPDAHDIIMARVQGSFASVNFTPCKDAFDGVARGFQADLEDIANRIMAGEQF